MKYQMTICGREHSLEFQRGHAPVCSLDGESFSADALEVKPGVYSIRIDGRSFLVHIDAAGDLSSNRGGDYTAHVDGVALRVSVSDPRKRRRGGAQLAAEGRQVVKAPMPGKVVRVLVAEGEAVEEGQGLVVVEAMKMQNEVKSPKAGSVQKVAAQPGQAVNAGETLVIVE